MARDYVIPGFGQVHEEGVEEFVIPGFGQFQEDQAEAGGRIMGSLAGAGGLAGPGGLAGRGGGMAG